MKNISVIGTGSWGTALANLIASNNHKVTAFSIEDDVIEDVNQNHQNEKYLPEAKLSENIFATGNLEEAVKNVEAIFLVTPAQTIRSVCVKIKNTGLVDKDIPLVLCSKGIECGTNKLMSEVVSEVFSENPLVILSGPNFAVEIVKLLPAVTTIASKNKEVGEKIVDLLRNDFFKPYYMNDIIAAQIAGTMKNVLAISCGIAAGMDLGENAKAALITRGFIETGLLCEAMGGKVLNLNSPAGIGDLVLTATSKKSRNMSLGFEIGQGKKTISEILEHSIATTEGAKTAGTTVILAKKYQIELPLCFAVDKILREDMNIKEIREILLSVF